ncbi:MAG: DUF1993 domain-containing protein [Betaproteobacteria bacterium]|nr:DUF1993 domain-containing protein [Betaproteobacteria bacterium]
MTVSLYRITAPAFEHTLGCLKDILRKAEDHAAAKKIDPSVFLNARLYPDMFTLTRQVQIATDVAKGACARITGQEIPKYEDNETSFAELQARINMTLAYIGSFEAKDIDGQEERDIVITPGGVERKFKGERYIVHWAIPNFYFHVMAAYCILRENGVEVGKMDFLGKV